MTSLTSEVTRPNREITLLSVWQILMEEHGDVLAVQDPHGDPVVEMSYRELFQTIQWFAAGLQAWGVQVGERVALISDNTPRWLIADLGSMFMGAVNVPRSSTADSQELGFILRNTDCSTVIVENVKTLKRLDSLIRELCIERIVVLSEAATDLPSGCLTLNQLLEKGKMHGFKPPVLTRSQLATIIHTSGTGGQPKGVMLTHGNLMHQVESVEQVVRPQPGDVVLSILPTWHSYERSCEYYLLSRACTLVYTDRRHIKQDFKDVNPHYLVAVPRIWESVYEGIQRQLKSQSGLKQRLIGILLKASEQFVLSRRIATNRSINHYGVSPVERILAQIKTLALQPLHIAADKLVFQKIRGAVGSNFKQAISGGGALAPYLDLFYEMANIEILVGYGLTETSPILTARRVEHNVRGTSGSPLPQTEIRTVDLETGQVLPHGGKGVIQARGPQVMSGYFKNPEATRKVLSDDGWFTTGDLGWVTPDNQLVITGRAKDVIVLSNGENIEPQPLEDACTQSPYIAQMMVVGQDQKYLGSLIYPDVDALTEWGRQQGLAVDSPDMLLANDAIKGLIQSELQDRIRNRPGYRADDQIRVFRFVTDPFTMENGLLTQTLKMKRLQVSERYRALIEEMFQ